MIPARDLPIQKWQQTIFDILKYSKVDNTINIVLTNNMRLNIFNLSRKCRPEKVGTSIHIMESYKTIYERILVSQDSNGYLIDIPEFITGIELQRIFYCIEHIKEGSFTYKHFDIEINPSHIWIFINKLPEFKYFKDPKYILWKIEDESLARFK